MKVFMYAHGGSGNHGCEAIVRSSLKILGGAFDEKPMLISSKPDEDKKYDIDKICDIALDKQGYSRHSADFMRAYLAFRLRGDYVPLDKMAYKAAFRQISCGDIALSIGGDNYCYADVSKYRMLHDMALQRGAKTVLWGCSVEPELTEVTEIAHDLARYSLITARETISYDALKKVNPNTVLVSDPAFLLEKSDMPLPDGFEKSNTVGINISPMIIDNESSIGIAMENYRALIRGILDDTDMNVALVPHVVWDDGDDRIPLKRLYNEFSPSGRVLLFGDMNCCDIKKVISSCSFFIGARTHATIAAYSTCVPTLVVGYSVKARGIARDIFGSEDGYVLPVQELKNEDDLTRAFMKLYENKDEIREHLQSFMPEYIERARLAGEEIKKLREA